MYKRQVLDPEYRVTLLLFRATFFTVTLQDRVLPATFARMVAEPAFLAVTLPLELTVATDFLDVDHDTFLVVPVTFSVVLLPTYMVVDVLLRRMLAALAGMARLLSLIHI